MARKTQPITDAEIRKTKVDNAVITLNDGGGLQMVIKPSGSKLWRLRYQHPVTRVRKLIGLGAYPAVSLASARKKRNDALALLSQKQDPHDVWQQQAKAEQEDLDNIFSCVAKRWFEIKKKNVTEDYAHDIWRSLELHVFPYLAETPITRITAPMLIDALQPVKAKGAFETIRRVCGRFNEIMDFAVNTGVIHANPTAKASAAFEAPKVQHLPSVPHQTLDSVLSTVNKANLSIAVRNCFYWSLLVAARPNEAAHLRWDEIDRDNMLVCISAERMKRRKAHFIPITKSMLRILDDMERLRGKSEFVFPSPQFQHKPINSQSVNAALKRCGLQGQLVAHGLRSIVYTAMTDHGFDKDLVEAVLAHSLGDQTREAYLRSDLAERRREVMDWWDEYVTSAIPKSF